MATKNKLTVRTYFILTGAVLLSVLLIVLAMPNTEKPRLPYTLGEPWMSSQLISPGEILIQKDAKQVEQEQQEALRADFVPYYSYDAGVGPTQLQRFTDKYGEGTADVPAYAIGVIAEVMKQVYDRGILPQADASQMLQGDSLAVVMVVNANEGVQREVRDLYSTKSAYEAIVLDPRLQTVRPAVQRMDINTFLLPNTLYDTQRSNQAKTDVLAMIPTNSGVMKQGQEIINRGDIVTEEKARMIDSYNEFVSSRSAASGTNLWLTNLVQITYVLIVLSLLATYVLLFRRDYFAQPRTLAMVLTLITLFPMANSCLMRYDPRNVYILPLALVPMFLRVFLDSRTAFMAHAVMVLICAAAVSDKFEFIVLQLVAGIVAIFALRELLKRSQIFSTAFVIFLSYVVMYTVVKWLDNKDIAFDALRHGYFCFIANGVLLLLTYPLMYVVEKTFGFVSPITLFELSDTNSPLLRRLSEIAPGTFQHSITVSNLAAAIAAELGGKALLLRTGALYHDIGKLANPAFFTENQSGVNPHNRLTPHESARIIIGHVGEGLRLAEKEGLPPVISSFIRTHHGTSLTRYFYNTYCNDNPDEQVDEKPFRYPGPNPSTQEQTILMMADAVEAASRSLPEYTEQTITTLVNRIIDQQAGDGAYAESPITFADIAIAKQVLIERLKSIYHTRIQYPELNTKI